MELSNKALTVLLLAAMVISLGGTIVSLNRMNQVEYVGFATTAQGVVNLSIGSVKSITTADGPIVNFGTCSISAGIVDYIDSELSGNTSIRCPDYAQSNISVRNDGNSNVSVTLQFSNCGPAFGNSGCTFLDTVDNSAALLYKTTSSGRGGYTGGCTSGPVTNYVMVNSTDPGLAGCTLLESGATANSFVANFEIGIPNTAPSGLSNVSITFTAS
ncbi:MAG: hypothetical protein ACP5N2_00465 [Candidatus Nanoarchaeia archaeon]